MTRSPGWEDDSVNLVNLDKQPSDVAAMFDGVARRYDLTNDVLSLGQDRRWRKAVTRVIDPQPGEVVLDLAAGTGTSSEPFDAAGAHVVPADFSLGMVRVGKRRRPDLGFSAADATRLPFRDDASDAVTISFGLRNVVDVGRRPPRASPGHQARRAAGALRVLPAGVGAVPDGVRRVPDARAATGRPCGEANPDSYVYLAESIQAWPRPASVGHADRRGGLAARGVAQPVGRHRRPASRPLRLTSGRRLARGTHLTGGRRSLHHRRSTGR